jgi:catechol 2,3-dioxygenase-like lactoylglutathione lyase family enzyme
MVESADGAQQGDPEPQLTNARICATVATTDLQRARHFYEAILGLKAVVADERRGVYYHGGAGTMLNLYERDQAAPQQSVATFLVTDLEKVMANLRRHGVSFEEYDLPDLKTVDCVYSDETGFKVSWFKDPDGNTLGIEQLPADLM